MCKMTFWAVSWIYDFKNIKLNFRISLNIGDVFMTEGTTKISDNKLLVGIGLSILTYWLFAQSF